MDKQELQKWRSWLGEKPAIYLNTFDGKPPPVCEVNLIGLAHDLLDAIDASVAAERERCAEEVAMLRRLVRNYEDQAGRAINERDFGA